MLSAYDLYDLSEVFTKIRAFPGYELNDEILSRTGSILTNRHEGCDSNMLRGVLRSIPSLDASMYGFVFVDNIYVYHPGFLKEEHVYAILAESCECLLKAVREGNIEKTTDLADCLHNLPVHIVDNHFTIPKDFWRKEVKYYRSKWDNAFLRE